MELVLIEVEVEELVELVEVVKAAPGTEKVASTKPVEIWAVNNLS